MNFTRQELNTSVIMLKESLDPLDRCIGQNYVLEENVSDTRRVQMEMCAPDSNKVRMVAKDYFELSVQGSERGHSSSTFDEEINSLALLPNTLEPLQKICRLENIDHLVEPRGDIEYNRLERALEEQDSLQLSLFAQSFQNFPGERPAFAVFKSEITEDLEQPDWTVRFVDRLGLYHYYQNNAGIPRRFALMEYTVAEVIEQAREKGISRCFAVPTILECPDNPAFFPAPYSARCGYIVDLRERIRFLPSIREYLHIRFDYSWNHLIRLGEWNSTELPDIELARLRHSAIRRMER